MAQAAAGLPNRFMTLTVNPEEGAGPDERRGMLADALKLLVKRLRGRPQWRDLQYFTVVEATEAGEPHLHVLLRSAFIPQAFVSDVMRELLNAPIVDIRRVRGVRQAVRYIAKYVAKAPARFGTFKRYWMSRGYELEPDDEPERHPSAGPGWTLVKECLHRVFEKWLEEGWTGRADGPGVYIGFRVTNLRL